MKIGDCKYDFSENYLANIHESLQALIGASVSKPPLNLWTRLNGHAVPTL